MKNNYQTLDDILNEVSYIYNEKYYGINDICKNSLIKNKNIKSPKDQFTILLISDTSIGKSCFINWYFQKEIQSSINNNEITFITAGKKDMTLPGKLTKEKYGISTDFSNSDMYLKTEVYETDHRSSHVVLINVPNLTEESWNFEFNYDETLAGLSDLSDIIICFIDLSPKMLISTRLKSFLMRTEANNGEKNIFILSKDDNVKSLLDKNRIILSVSQKLSEFLKSKIDLFYLSKDNKIDDEISYITNKIDLGCNSMVKNVISYLQNDVYSVTVSGEEALLKMKKSKKKIFNDLILLVLFFVLCILSYTIKGIFRKWRTKIPMIIILSILLISFFLLPKKSEQKQIEDFLEKRAKQIRIKINHFNNILSK